MRGQASLPNENAWLPLRVEHDKDVLSGKRTRLLWTGLGFAVVMLIGVLGCAHHMPASHESARPSHVLPAVATHVNEAPSFIPPLTGLHPESGGARLTNLRSARQFALPSVTPSRTIQQGPITRVSMSENFAAGADGELSTEEQENLEILAGLDATTVFAMMDINGDGVVSQKEFETYLAAYGHTKAESTRIFVAMDANRDRVIDVEEVKQLFKLYYANTGGLSAKNSFSEVQLVERRAQALRMFDEIDTNSDGEISSEEMRSYLMSVGYTNVAAYAVLCSLDTDDNGKISRSELCMGFERYAAVREAIEELVSVLTSWHPAMKNPVAPLVGRSNLQKQ